MNKLLIAADLSAMKSEVISTGIELAEKLGASIDLVTVINKNLDYIPADIGYDFSDQWQARKFIAESGLKEIIAQYPTLDIKMNVFIGDPKKDLIDIIINDSITMVVLGTHGRTGLSHMVMGSTAEYVIRHSTVPVVVVPYIKQAH